MTRVLVVEDVETSAYYLRALLEGHGYQVERARHGAEALVMARQTPPDVVVSDLLMPVMDGYTLLRQWRADPRLGAVPFIVYTATYTDAEDERLALDLGADAFVLKPAEPEVFLDRLRDVQTRAATRATAAVAPHGEGEILEQYSAALIRKLEDKMRELELANAALAREQAVLQLRDRAIQAVSQGIVIADALAPDLPIVYASPGFERMTGYRADEVLGRNCRFLQGPATDPAAAAAMRRALAQARACTVELRNYRKDGSAFWNSVAISPVNEGGRVTHFVGVQTDVTERRELESQLRQAQRIEAIGQLAAGVAHDFNNLLSVILTYSALLLDDPTVSPTGREDLAEIRRAGERASDLVRQLLAFSRRQVLQPRVLDVGQLVAGMERMLRSLVGDDVALSLVGDRALGRVSADPTQLEQIVLNLAVNARDAMPGGGMLVIETANARIEQEHPAALHGVTPGAYVMLAVHDSGVGIDPEIRERIFEPFFTTKEQGKGTGLGLATVFGVVKQSGGHIWVESERGRGTTFRVYLPSVDRAIDATPPPAAPPVTLRGSETVLVVEDDSQLRATIAGILRRHGYEVLAAHNGGEALLIAEQHAGSIALMIASVVMPRIGGPQLAQRLRPLRPEMKVLLVSGHSEGARESSAEPVVAAAYIAKPITPSVLVHRVRELLDAKPSAT